MDIDSNKYKELFAKALLLEYITIFWNSVEGILTIATGVFSHSIALYSYGLESSIEVFVSLVVVWQLSGGNMKREKRALKLIGAAYLLVSLYIFIQATQGLLAHTHANRSLFGILLLIIATIGMIVLGLFKKRVGKLLQNNAVTADGKFSLIDAGLSSTVLIGLLLNVFFGFWWADQAMALLLSGVAFREGLRELV